MTEYRAIKELSKNVLNNQKKWSDGIISHMIASLLYRECLLDSSKVIYTWYALKTIAYIIKVAKPSPSSQVAGKI